MQRSARPLAGELPHPRTLQARMLYSYNPLGSSSAIIGPWPDFEGFYTKTLSWQLEMWTTMLSIDGVPGI